MVVPTERVNLDNHATMLRPGNIFRVHPEFDWSWESSAYGINHFMVDLAGTVLTVKEVIDILGNRGYIDEENGFLWSEEWVDEVEDITVVKTDIAPVS